MCKKFDGFIRVAFSHPQDERFNRRCWVTFNNNVNIKDICWNLNNIRLKDVELNPVVNRDLQRRARPMSSLSNHNVIMYQGLIYMKGKQLILLLIKLKNTWKIMLPQRRTKLP